MDAVVESGDGAPVRGFGSSGFKEVISYLIENNNNNSNTNKSTSDNNNLEDVIGFEVCSGRYYYPIPKYLYSIFEILYSLFYIKLSY